MKILLIGLSHKTAPVEIRERLDFSRPTTLRATLTHFDKTHSQAHLEDVQEGVILSTCNRTEVYALVKETDTASRAIINLLSQMCAVSTDVFANHLYIREEAAAVTHLFRVAAGLDSLVLGEPQILGQITDAYEAALSQQAAGTVLSALFRAAIHAGKRVRTDTRIGVNAASISSVAAGLATQLLGDLQARQVLLIGAGEMGAIAVRALRQRGATNIVVSNRTFATAQKLAAEWDGQAITFQQLPDYLAKADIVITSTGAPHTILDRRLLAPAIETRAGRPLFIIDIAVPRDVNPNVTELPNVHLRDIDDLQTQVDDNVQSRRDEIPRVETIVQEEVVHFLEWYSSLDVVATITDLRRLVEQLRQRELTLLFNRLELDEHETKLVKMMSQRLINKILHTPTLRLKGEAAHGNGVAYVSALRRLFSLTPDEEKES